MKTTPTLLLALLLASVTQTPGAPGPLPTSPWPAIDDLGRPLPLHPEVGAPTTDRFVGMFYFLWHEAPMAKRSPRLHGPYDISNILQLEPDALQRPNSPLWGGIGVYHYWGEPLYGYYLSHDPWVLRRHAFLLADAGIDVLIFDTTNALTYRDVYFALCNVFRQIRQAGGHTPQIAFMVNTRAGDTALKIYQELYAPAQFPELWFHWDGKPLLLCDPKDAPAPVRDFFTLRRAHWPFDMTNTLQAWHWEATYPQAYGFKDDPAQPEQISVSAAQNLRARDGKVTNMSFGDARGRSFKAGQQQVSPGSANEGHNFQEQWERAHALQAPFVLVTSWNEWIAGRWGSPDGPLVFVDQLDHEFSRDVEPMRGGHGDNYYLQLVANVRRFKGAPALPPPAPARTLRVPGPFDQWAPVQSSFLDHLGEVAPRSFPGAAGLHYQNHTGRNDLQLSKVAHNTEHLFFLIQCADPIRLAQGHPLCLLLDVDQNATNGWFGYDSRVQFSSTGAILETYVDGAWQARVPLPHQTDERQLHLAIPRRSLHLAETSPFSIDFKWTDNVTDANPLAFYVDGDVAPESRFNYRYTGQ